MKAAGLTNCSRTTTHSSLPSSLLPDSAEALLLTDWMPIAPRSSETTAAPATGEVAPNEADARREAPVADVDDEPKCVLDGACRGRDITRLVLLVAMWPPGVMPCPGVAPARVLLVTVCIDQSSLLERSWLGGDDVMNEPPPPAPA